MGDILIYGKGVLILENAKLDLSGHIWVQDRGRVIVRDSAQLHFNQTFLAQYQNWLNDSASFEATDATIDGNGFPQYGRLYNRSSF